MAVKRLTETGVARINPESGRHEIADELVTGLTLRVSTSGVKSWYFIYRLGGKQRRMLLGHYPDISLRQARDIVRQGKEQMAYGNDPYSLRQKKIMEQIRKEEDGLTIEKLSADFIERYAKPKNRTWKGTQQLIENHILPAFGGKTAKDLRRKEIIELLDKLAASDAPSAANHVLATLRKIYNWAIERDMLEFNPCSNIKRPVTIQERERVLTREEIRHLWETAEKIGYPYGPVLQLLLLTGQRRGEIATLRWSYIDLDKQVIHLPPENVKANRGHDIPLSEMAVKILESLPRFDGPYVFSMTHGVKAIAGFGKTKPTIDKVFGVDDWRIHDLRRTAATGMAELGVPLPTISRILNHSEGGVTRLYARYSFLNEKRQALNLWAQHIHAIMHGDGGKKSNVVKLHEQIAQL